MTRERWRQLIIAFWVVIIGMLLWQFVSYNQSMTQQAVQHPAQTQFIFLHTNAPAAAPGMSHSNTADIKQSDFTVQPNTPSTFNYTCVITLKNVGHAPATGIQVWVRPYRGTSNYDEDIGQQRTRVLDDHDPISMLGDWLSFPDLAPGESATRTDVFLNRTDAKPGSNPNPQIIFETVKPQPGAKPASSTPSTTPAPVPDATPAPATPRTHQSPAAS
jgi:hypothetical protein